MTEEEAKTKWCPMAKTSIDENCIASGCMMWVWDTSPQMLRHQAAAMDVRATRGNLEACGHCGLVR